MTRQSEGLGAQSLTAKKKRLLRWSLALPSVQLAGPSQKKEPPMSTFEVSITVSVVGSDIDRGLLSKAQNFLVERMLAGKCSLEHGGTAYHLHLHMVVRLQAKPLIFVSKMLISYLGWDSNQLARGMVMCKRLANKGLHTFHGLLVYCMKDASKDHFETVDDHNVTVAALQTSTWDWNSMHYMGRKRTRIGLCSQCKIWWREFSCGGNCRHPLDVDFARDLFEMLKTGKYYPACGHGRGYEPYKMQSLYKMMVTPHDITREDVANVTEHIWSCVQEAMVQRAMEGPANL